MVYWWVLILTCMSSNEHSSFYWRKLKHFLWACPKFWLGKCSRIRLTFYLAAHCPPDCISVWFFTHMVIFSILNCPSLCWVLSQSARITMVFPHIWLIQGLCAQNGKHEVLKMKIFCKPSVNVFINCTQYKNYPSAFVITDIAGCAPVHK